jgi:hypothetical protein
MTGLIGLSCPASLKMQDRTGSPFGRKSPPVQEPFDAAIDSTEAGSFRWAAPTEKCSWSYPFSANPVSPALGGRGSRNCRLSSSQVPVAKSTVGLATNPGLPFSGWVWGPEARLVYWHCPNVVPQDIWPSTFRCRRNRRSNNQRERKVSGQLGGGGFEVGPGNLPPQTSAAARKSSVDLLVDTQAADTEMRCPRYGKRICRK